MEEARLVEARLFLLFGESFRRVKMKINLFSFGESMLSIPAAIERIDKFFEKIISGFFSKNTYFFFACCVFIVGFILLNFIKSVFYFIM